MTVITDTISVSDQLPSARSFPVGQKFNPYKLFNGSFIPEAICKHRGLSMGSKMTYGRLCRFAGQNGIAYPAVATLAEELGIGTTQTRHYLRELENAGFIEGEDQPGQARRYHFLFHAAFCGELGDPERTASMFSVDHQPPQRKPVAPPQRGAVGVPQRKPVAPPQRDAVAEESHCKRVTEESQANARAPEAIELDSLMDACGISYRPRDAEKLLATGRQSGLPVAAVLRWIHDTARRKRSDGDPIETGAFFLQIAGTDLPRWAFNNRNLIAMFQAQGRVQ